MERRRGASRARAAAAPAARRLAALSRHVLGGAAAATSTSGAEAAASRGLVGLAAVEARPPCAPLAPVAVDGGAAADARSRASKELYAVRRQGHSVPSTLKESGGSAVVFYENNARRLSHAEKARTMLACTQNGTLSTLHHQTGWPYGSVLNFATEVNFATEHGLDRPRLITFVSRLAEHSANLAADNRASLLVSAVQGDGDRLATARATFQVEAVQVEKTDGAKNAFLGAHPNASYVHFDDFLCFELQVHCVRYIGGFGEMSWVDGDAFAGAEPDPVGADAESANAAVKHCNEDHADAVLEMARAFSGLADAEAATMLTVDRYGFDVLCTMPDGLRRSRVEFPSRLELGGSLREVIVDTTMRARALLGKGK